MALHNTLGKWGEDIAASYLISHGWYIRHRNWLYNHKEIDIVCIDEDMTTLLIVEVKTRSTDAFGDPDEFISLEKKNNLIRAAQAYIRSYNLSHLAVRYDTISVIGTPDVGHRVEHKEGAYDVSSQLDFREHEYHKTVYKKRHRKGRW